MALGFRAPFWRVKMIKCAECVPATPVIRISDWYESTIYPWLYVYRYTGPQSKVDKMVAVAEEMAAQGSIYNYVNNVDPAKGPIGFGPLDWCCVTVCSYWVHAAGITPEPWIMGSNKNDYFWSPRYGGTAYDDFLLENGFEKLKYSKVGKEGLWKGDIVQRWNHTVTITEGNDEMTNTERAMLDGLKKDVVLKKGSKGELVTFIKNYMKYWGHYPYTIKNDKFGSKLKKSIMGWQQLNNRKQTGQIREADWTQIEDDRLWKL